MKFQSKLEKENYHNIYHTFFYVPDNVVSSVLDDTNKRVVCTVNGKVKYHCAIHGDGTGRYRIMLNQQRVKELGLMSGETIEVELQKDTSEYGVEMSEELREVLDQNPDADRIFHAFTKGMQRTLIYWVDNVKSSEIKIRRALVMTDHIINQNGKPDYKQLNAEIKAANQAAKRG
jgi:hypothetical protein